ncbi:hypothetical protein QHL21_22665 [Escherichia coli]|uniref:hypothetical protein n=1 Tax=Escherichia coli TaxID=562 RepID=UPI0024803268|nr:hypothetical protein [Escherichia coli]MDH7926946.1 hypothetical protein [Escherichia coli]
MTHKFKGTDGTWVNCETAIWAGDVYVAEVMSMRENDSVKLANAKLISSAPELLEALRQLRDYVEDVCAVSSDDYHEDHPLNLAKRAIEKALGKK